jgi:hypothetical protein
MGRVLRGSKNMGMGLSGVAFATKNIKNITKDLL